MKTKATSADVHGRSSAKHVDVSGDIQAVAVKRLLSSQLERDMRRLQLTKAAMARRMGTTRTQLDRLLSPENPSTTLQTLVRAADALGKRVKIVLVSR